MNVAAYEYLPGGGNSAGSLTGAEPHGIPGLPHAVRAGGTLGRVIPVHQSGGGRDEPGVPGIRPEPGGGPWPRGRAAFGTGSTGDIAAPLEAGPGDSAL